MRNIFIFGMQTFYLINLLLFKELILQNLNSVSVTKHVLVQIPFKFETAVSLLNLITITISWALLCTKINGRCNNVFCSFNRIIINHIRLRSHELQTSSWTTNVTVTVGSCLGMWVRWQESERNDTWASFHFHQC